VKSPFAFRKKRRSIVLVPASQKTVTDLRPPNPDPVNRHPSKLSIYRLKVSLGPSHNSPLANRRGSCNGRMPVPGQVLVLIQLFFRKVNPYFRLLVLDRLSAPIEHSASLFSPAPPATCHFTLRGQNHSFFLRAFPAALPGQAAPCSPRNGPFFFMRLFLPMRLAANAPFLPRPSVFF